MCRRRGVGNRRHLAAADMWVQDRSKTKCVAFTKTPSADNPSEVLTKHVVAPAIKKHLANMNCVAEDGRASSAPELIRQSMAVLHVPLGGYRHHDD